MQRFSPSGARIGGETIVNTTRPGTQRDPSVAMNPTGAFAVVWHGSGPQGTGIYFQHFDAAGTPRNGEVLVNVVPVGFRCHPEVVMGTNGDIVVVWAHDDGRLVLRRFSRNGGAQSSEMFVGTTPSTISSLAQARLSVAAKSDGAFVVVWPGAGGVYGQRFAPGSVADEALPEASAFTVSVAPTPSGPSGATIRYVLAVASPVRISVVDVLGREVAVVLDEVVVSEGEHAVAVNTSGWPAGFYLVRAEVGERVTLARLIVAR